MDNVLAEINVEDPTAAVDKDTEMADVAPRAVEKQDKQAKDKKKKEKKSKREEGGETRKKRKHAEANGEVDAKKNKQRKELSD